MKKTTYELYNSDTNSIVDTCEMTSDEAVIYNYWRNDGSVWIKQPPIDPEVLNYIPKNFFI